MKRGLVCLNKKILASLLVVVLLGASGYSIYMNYQQIAELKELRNSNNDLADTLESLKLRVDDLEYVADSNSQSTEDIETMKLDEIQQSIQALEWSIKDLDSRLFDIELWQ